MSVTVVLFDIDGTLLLDGGAAGRAFDSAFRDIFGIGASAPQVEKAGRSDIGIAADITRCLVGRELRDEEWQALSRRYVELLPDELESSAEFRLMPGVVELCEALAREQSTVLGLQTGNIRMAATLKLRRGNLDRFFRFGGFGCDHVERPRIVERAIERATPFCGEAASSCRIVVIGDTPHDVSAARDAGAVSIAVATGRHSMLDLAECHPDHLFPSLEDIGAAMRAIAGGNP